MIDCIYPSRYVSSTCACLFYDSFRFVIYHNQMNIDYRNLLFDDYDSESDDGYSDGEIVLGDNNRLDTLWIDEYEKQLMYDEYRLFFKTDVTSVTFEMYYLDHDKTTVERIMPMKYTLKNPNQITQNELFSIIRSYQHLDKKYYNFHTLLFYSFEFQDNNGKDVIRGLSEYLRKSSAGDGNGNGNGDDVGHFIEYTNLLSIDTICIAPVLTMFHDIIGFSVLLYED